MGSQRILKGGEYTMTRKTKENIFIILGTMLAIFIGYHLADGWFSAKYQTPTAYRDTTPAKIVKPKVDTQVSIDTIKEEFIDGCSPDGTDREFCGCGFDYMLRVKGVAWIGAEGISYNATGQMSDEFAEVALEAAKVCL